MTTAANHHAEQIVGEFHTIYPSAAFFILVQIKLTGVTVNLERKEMQTISKRARRAASNEMAGCPFFSNEVNSNDTLAVVPPATTGLSNNQGRL